MQRHQKIYRSITRMFLVTSDTNFESFIFKARITERTPADSNTKNDEVVVLPNYLSNFWRTLEMLFMNCEINLKLTWSANSVITNSRGSGTFEIEDVKLDVPIVTLST